MNNRRKMSPTARPPSAKQSPPPGSPTQWVVAKPLAAHFSCSPNTAKQWFDSGCPQDFEAAVAWKVARDADRTIRGVSGRPNKLMKVIAGKAEAAQADDFMPLCELSESFREAVDLVVELRQAGITATRIAPITGFRPVVLRRIFSEDPRLQTRKQATTAWGIAREIAVDRLIDLLDSEEQAKKLTAMQLASVAGIASDKLKDMEPPPEQISVSIRAKIEAIPYEELLKMLPTAEEAAAQSEDYLPPAALPLPGGKIIDGALTTESSP